MEHDGLKENDQRKQTNKQTTLHLLDNKSIQHFQTSDILKCKHHTHVPWSGCVLLGQNSKNVNYHNKLSHVNCLSIYTLLGVQEKFSFE